MLNCTDPECILHHHHYYHGHIQHHLQDDRAHHEHPTHHPMSGEPDGVKDAVIQDYLNDTDSELSSLSHLDAPNDSVFMVGGVVIAMCLVAIIIILLAVTIRFKVPPRNIICCKCCRSLCKFSKLRKREESSGVHRSNVVHPEGVLQATVVGGAAAEPTQDLGKTSPLEDIFIAPVSNRTSSTYSESYQSTDTTQSLPMFLYSTNSRNSLNSGNDQDVLVHPYGPAEDIENNNNSINNNNNINTNNKEDVSKKNIKGKLKKLVRRKTPPADNYALPIELREQLKQIYVY